VDRLLRALPQVAVVAGALLLAIFGWTKLVSHGGTEFVLPVRAALIEILLACLLFWALVAPSRSVTSRFFRWQPMVFLGTYSYGLYVYHYFVSYYLLTSQTEFSLTQQLGSHGLAVALQATVGIVVSLAIAYASYELFEKRLLSLKRFFGATENPRFRLNAKSEAVRL